MDCSLAEIVPSSDTNIQVLTGVTPDTETVFINGASDPAVLSVPPSFDVNAKPFRLVVAGKATVTNSACPVSVRLVLGSSSDLGSNTTILTFVPAVNGATTVPFYFNAECLWDSGSEKITFAYKSIVRTTVDSGDVNISSVASQSDLQFALFGKIGSTDFDSSDSISITEFKLELV